MCLGSVMLIVGALTAKNAKDEVLMTVNGIPVYKSEFEYLYNKNAAQQIDHKSLNDYLEMFVNYKLKVADALANKYDTTATFTAELRQYSDELSAPYLKDADVEKQLLDEAYQHYMNLLKVSHLMLPATRNGQDAEQFAKADSIRTAVMNGTLLWDDAVRNFSIDRGTNKAGGNMGWIVAGRLPSAFEDMAYATPVGEISQPVNSGFGIHLIRVDDQKANPGEVKARHILKLTSRKSPAEAAKAKEQIDSIYEVLMQGADFADVARRESEDPGSKTNGGELDWFGVGTMVAPFDSAAFTMAEGVISRPVRTSYGWHIIEVTGHRPPKSRDEMTGELVNVLMRSEKSSLPTQAYIESKAKAYNNVLIEKSFDEIEKMIAANPNGCDSVMIAELTVSNMPVAKINGSDVPLSSVFRQVTVPVNVTPSVARQIIESGARNLRDEATLERARETLKDTNEQYRNLINEYSDGILLFDISQAKVWQKATDDREGLAAFFKANKSKYTFDEPRFKAVVVFTTADSLETEIKNYLDSLPPAAYNNDLSKINTVLRDKFGKSVRAERVIAKKGENAITDFLAFGGEKPDVKNSWTNYFAFKGEIIDQPVEVDDVRGKVVADYQHALENEWLDELHKKYPVKINEKVLKTIEEIQVN